MAGCPPDSAVSGEACHERVHWTSSLRAEHRPNSDKDREMFHLIVDNEWEQYSWIGKIILILFLYSELMRSVFYMELLFLKPILELFRLKYIPFF